MSDSKIREKKRTRLLREHPFCCFCGGLAPSTTIDHVPNRACFKERAFPDTYEFPACDGCQNRSRKAEQAFAFAVQMLEFDTANQDLRSWSKTISGLANNFPEALPNPFISDRAKRQGLARLGLSKPSGVFLSELPISLVPPAMDESIRSYTIKIAIALWYREKNNIVPSYYLAFSYWRQSVDATINKLMEETIRITPLVRIGERSNLDFRNRFIYRCNLAFEPDVFLVTMQFGASIVATCLIVEPKARELITADRWRRLDEIFD